MTLKLLLLPVGELPRVVDVEPTLENLQALVGGDIEVHGIQQWGRPYADLYCHEDGKRLELPVNLTASAFFESCGVPFLDYDRVLGPAFLTGPTNGEGEMTDVPDPVVAHAQAVHDQLQKIAGLRPPSREPSTS